MQDTRREDGYVNATKWAKSFGYDLSNWKRLPETKARLKELENNYVKITDSVIEDANNTANTEYVKNRGSKSNKFIYSTGRGYGAVTWVHPIMAVHLASYLDPAFANFVAEIFVRYVTADPHLAADIASRQETTKGLDIINEAVQERYSFLEGKDWDWEGRGIDYGDEFANFLKEYNAERFLRLEKKFGLTHKRCKGIYSPPHLLNSSLIKDFLKDKYPSIYSGMFCTHYASYEEKEDDIFGLVGYFKEEIEVWVKERNGGA